MKNLYLILCVFFVNILFSQNLQNSNWTFGNNNLMNFPSSATPTVSTISPLAFSIYHTEGVASVSDSAGNLLLYSDGIKLWHVSGGITTLVTSALMGSISSAQNLIFIPKPNTPNRYMLVYIHGGTDLQLGLFYSEIDFSGVPFMVSLNVPLLDFLGNPIDSTISYNNMSEALTSTIHSDGINYWIVAAVQAYPNYSISVLSYLLTQNGFQNSSGLQDAPIRETTYPIVDNGEFPLGVKISRDTKKIAMTTSALNTLGVFMGNFDNATGVVTPVVQITDPIPYTYGYGLEFSPNSSLLYYTTNKTGAAATLHQLETQNWSQVGILSSATQFYGGLQFGLDDNIYVASGQSNLFTINNPDSISPTLTLSNLALNNFSGYALPQWVWEHGNCFYTLNANADVLTNDVDHEERIDWIKAENTINSGGEALYHAGNYLELNPGFEAIFGSQFEAEIAPCDTPFSYRLSVDLDQNSTQSQSVKDKKTVRNLVNQVKIYPNPSSTTINVEYVSNLKNIKIMSMDGKTMLNRNVSANTSELDVSGFANGLYLISAETQDGKILQSKFVKN